jgi:amino acid adenylation domain-containing protein
MAEGEGRTNASNATSTGARFELRPLGPRPQSGPAPLSRMQQRLVFIQELQPDKPLYQVPTAIRLRGPVDPTLLERCLRELTLRHEVLLSKIGFHGAVPGQVVDRDCVIPLERVDLSTTPSEEREQALLDLLHRRGNTPMVLTEGPLIQFVLIQLAEDDRVFFFMPHHVVWDGASLEIFLRELDALYSAWSRGEPSPLRPLPIQYADFAAWHEEYVTSAALDEARKFWLSQLTGNLASLDLPADRPRPARMTYAGATAWWRLDKAEVAALTQLGLRVGATFYMVLLAAYAGLLHRYTSHPEIFIGTPVRGRSWRRTQGLIGMFVNTLVLRLRTDPNLSFIDLMRTVKEVSEASFDNPNMPLDVLVRELNLSRDPSRSPLAQSFFVFRDIRDVKPSLLGVPATEIPLHAEFETQDLTLWATQNEDGIVGVLTFATDLFDRSTMEAFIDHYRRFLREAARDADSPIGKLPIVGDAELAKLDAFNATTASFPEDACVHTLIEAQAKRTPDATAVVAIGSARGAAPAITYRELDERSNRLARHLRSLGVRRDVRVGLAVERSIDLVVAQLAVLKAGGAYVPLDPSYPTERLAHMTEDSAMVVLITQTSLEEGLPKTNAARVRLDADAGAIAEHAPAPLDDPDAAALPHSLAYVIYTSGSTGKPKGVLVPHRPLVNFIESMKKTPGIGPGDVVLAVTTLSFDIAVFDTLTALAAGAKVLIASREVTGDGELLRDAMIQHAVTLLNATPATWRLLLAAGWTGARSFRAITAGEALPKDLAIELVKRCGEVWDLYGPTETTVWSTYWKAEPPVERILIGHPIDNTEVHILDPHGNRCPIGVVGEVVIAGEGVTKGYLNRPELTSERFVLDPFRGPPWNMYRTGDLGRWLASGELEYLGRRDTQVKLRGFRIELGEIEAVIAAHDAVAEAVASICEDDPLNPMLVAYVVTRAGASWTATELRKLVRGKLPPYMVPQHVVELAELPLTPAGKVDRRRLPPPFGKVDVERTYVGPSTDQERLLSALCAELLRLERVSTTENFFDLGGHSMLSLTLIARIEERTAIRLNPRVFLTNSIAQVAALLPSSNSAARTTAHGPSSVREPSSERERSESHSPPEKKPLATRLLARVGRKLFGR